MKKLWILLIVALLLSSCTSKSIEYSEPYGLKSDMSGYDLDTDRFIDITVDETLELIGDQKSTVIIYLGYETCPWCRCLLPLLNDLLVANNIKAFYLDFHADINYNDAEDLWKIVDMIGSKGYLDKDDDGEYKLAFPAVIYLQKGEIINCHTGTVSGHDAAESSLSEKQTARLQYMLQKEYESLFK